MNSLTLLLGGGMIIAGIGIVALLFAEAAKKPRGRESKTIKAQKRTDDWSETALSRSERSALGFSGGRNPDHRPQATLPSGPQKPETTDKKP